MRRTFAFSLLCCLLAATLPASAASTNKLIKVLPFYLDLNGKHAISPSLFERDAYQAILRTHPEQRSTMRFDLQWKSPKAPTGLLKLRVETRGAALADAPASITLEQIVKPGGHFSHWTTLALTREEYKKLGTVTSWRATFWDGDKLLGEQQSFLW